MDDVVEHGSAPDEGLVAGVEEAHRHDDAAEVLEGLDAIAEGVGGVVDVHHAGDIGAVDVGVEKADLVAEAGDGDGEVDGDGGFADAAFAGTDGDEVLDAFDGQFGEVSRAGRLAHLAVSLA